MLVGSGTTENTPIVGRNASKYPYGPAGPLNTPILGIQVVQHLAENRPISLTFQPSHPGKLGGKSPPPPPANLGYFITLDLVIRHTVKWYFPDLASMQSKIIKTKSRGGA